MSAGLAFDRMAEDYDRTFTDTPIGRCLRNAVWRRLDAVYPQGASVLEVNCGTGEDAIHLASRGVRVLATDAAPAMVEVARRKVAAADLEGRVRIEQVAIEDVGPHLGTFDGVVSNFGGLNCVADLRGAAVALARCVRPGGTAVLCLMGPAVPWEWAWYLARGEPARAFRRFRRGGVEWRGLTVRYPSIAWLRRAFAPEFRMARVAALGALVPPAYTAAWAARHPRLLAALERTERAAETVFPLPRLSDHYLAELRRSDQ